MTALMEAQAVTEEKAVYKTVRLRQDVYENAKRVANLRGIDLMVYLSEVLGPIAAKDLKAEARKIAGGDK